jgi:hypothetical protein
MSNFSVYTRIIDWLYVAFVYMSMSTIRHDCCSKAENEENKNMKEQGLLDDVSTTTTTDSWKGVRRLDEQRRSKSGVPSVN